MANLKTLRQRIHTINSTKKITSAMKLIATSHFKKFQKNYQDVRSYTQSVHRVLSGVLSYEPLDHEIPLLISGNKGKKHLLILLGSDKGLCGAFNFNVVKHALHHTSKLDLETSILCIGEKIFSSLPFSMRSHVVKDFPMSDKKKYADVLELAYFLENLLLSGTFDTFSIAYNQFKSIICYLPTVHRLIPFGSSIIAEKDGRIKEKNELLFGVEPSVNNLSRDLAFKNLTAQLYYACIESQLSEHSARMMAMDSSTNNAEDMLKTLKTTYHRSRQAMITNELIEIIAGAESL